MVAQDHILLCNLQEKYECCGCSQVIQKEVITREVVTIPCKYCGGLMVQILLR
jgi:hypothetical protein